MTSFTDSNVSGRPKSSIGPGAAASPRQYSIQNGVAAPEKRQETDEKTLASNNSKPASVRPKSEFPLRSFPEYQSGESNQQKTGQSDARHHNNDSIIELPESSQSDGRRQSRGRIQSSGTPPTYPAHERVKRRNTPSDPGGLEGIPLRPLQKWDRDTNPTVEGKPPIPVRNYKQDSDPNMLEKNTRSSWEGDKPRPHAAVDQSTQTTRGAPDDGLQRLPGYLYREDNYPKRSASSRNSSPRRHEVERKGESRDGTPHKDLESPDRWSPTQRPEPSITPGSDSVFSHGTDNLAYVRETATPRAQPHANRRYENVQLNPDVQQQYRGQNDIRNRPQQLSQFAYAMDERQRQLRHRHMNHPRIDGIVHPSHQRPNYDPHRSTFIPGVYLRPKPYYQPRGMQGDPTKRFSDASDYSDVIYADRSPYYAERVNRDFDPYFFRSRWSITPDAKPADDVYMGRRNSDFMVEEATYMPGLASYQQQQQPQQQSEQQQHQKQETYERSRADEKQYDPDIIREYPKLRPRSGGSSRLSSGYQSQSSKADQPSPEPYPQALLDRPDNLPHYQVAHRPQPPPVGRRQRLSDSRASKRQQQSTKRKESSCNQPHNPMPESPWNQSNPTHVDDARGPTPPTQPTSPTPPVVPESPQTHQKITERKSSDYGSLIDVLYRYQRGVRDSRKNEAQEESSDIIELQREKLRNKLRKELSPHHRQTKNLDMVIETLLFLCENDNKPASKRSWQRECHNGTDSKSRPSSEIYLKQEKEEMKESTTSNQAKSKNRKSSLHQKISIDPEKEKIVTSEIMTSSHDVIPPKIPQRRNRERLHDYYEITPIHSAPPCGTKKEFAFPSEEELARVLEMDDSKPPVPPPRRKKLEKEAGIQREALRKTESRDNPSVITNNQHLRVSPNDEVEEKPDVLYSKVNKKKRISLPNIYFSESELKWLAQTSKDTEKDGFQSEISWKPSEKAKSPRVESSEHVVFSPERDKKTLSGDKEARSPEKSCHFDDIVIDDTMDAEDVINAIEKRERMNNSKGEKSPSASQTRRSAIPYQAKHSIASESDMGTMSSVASSGLPPTPPPRARLYRSEGVYPSTDSSPIASPDITKHVFHSSPSEKRTNSPIVPPRKESLSPVKKLSMFQTTPLTPDYRPTSPLALSNKSTSVSSVTLHSSSSSPAPASPKLLSPNTVSQFNPRKVPTPSKTPHKSQLKHAMPQSSSAPNTPAIANVPVTRRGSRQAPKLPFSGKRFVKSLSEESPNIPEERKPPHRLISRTGEIITIPADDDYAVPLDCIRSDVTNLNSDLAAAANRDPGLNLNKHYDVSATSGHAPSPLHRQLAVGSPKITFNHSESSRFYPITEQRVDRDYSDDGSDYDDYAIPVNTTPWPLLRQKIFSKSADNLTEFGYK